MTQNKTISARDKMRLHHEYTYRAENAKLPPPCKPDGQEIGVASEDFRKWLSARTNGILCKIEQDGLKSYRVGPDLIAFYRRWGFLPGDREVVR